MYQFHGRDYHPIFVLICLVVCAQLRTLFHPPEISLHLQSPAFSDSRSTSPCNLQGRNRGGLLVCCRTGEQPVRSVAGPRWSSCISVERARPSSAVSLVAASLESLQQSKIQRYQRLSPVVLFISFRHRCCCLSYLDHNAGPVGICSLATPSQVQL